MRGRALRFADFTGGANPSAGPSGLAENEAYQLTNVRPTVRGSLVGRAGDSEVVDTTAIDSSEITSLNTVGALGAGELEGLIVGTANGKLRVWTTSMAASLGTFTVGKVWDFIDAPVNGGQGPVYGVNGTDAKYITAASAINNWTAATGTFPAGAKYLAYVGNRVWAAGMAAYGSVADPASTLVFSNLGDPRDWPAANVVQFDPNDGESITGIGEVGSGLLVFKRSKAWLVYDLDTGANRPLGVGVGCMSHRSIQQTPQGTVFLGERNVWITDGTTTRSISDNIETQLTSYLGDGYLPLATSTTDGQRYLLNVSGVVWEYDFELKSWWAHSVRGGVIASARLNGESDEIHVGGTAGLDVMFSGGHLDAAGSVLSRIWIGCYHTFGPGRERLRGIRVEGLGTFGVGAIPEFGAALTSGTMRDEEALGATPTIRDESDFSVASGLHVAFYATGTDAPAFTDPIPGYVSTDLQINGYTLYVTQRRG
jgi:hypothetical protein